MTLYDYRVVVEVHELQSLIWPDPHQGVKPKLPNPFLEVILANECQNTTSKEATANCSIQRCFFFSDVPLQETLEFRVYHKGFLGQKELIGISSTSLNTVREMPEHRLIHAMSPLVTSERPSEPRGFIRFSLHVLKMGEVFKKDDHGESTTHRQMKSSVEENSRILATPVLKFNCYNVTLNFHLGTERIVILFSGQDILKKSNRCQNMIPSTFLRAIFMDKELSTSVSRKTHEPTWSEALRFPATYPCSNDTILIELWLENDDTQRISHHTLSFLQLYKAQRMVCWVNFYTERLTSQHKRRNRPHPTSRQTQSFSALNVLTSFFDLEARDNTDEPLMEYNYLGRVLFSASCDKVENACLPAVLRCSPISTPLDQEFILWIDLFELSGVKEMKYVTIQLCLGDWEVSITSKTSDLEGVCFSEQEGRVAEERFFLPSYVDMAYDLIVRIYGQPQVSDSLLMSDASKFLGYARLSPSVLLKKENVPYWIDIIPIVHEEESLRDTSQYHSEKVYPSSLSLLASIILRNVKESTQQRPKRLEFSVNHYTCEATIYQAVSLPVLPSCLPSPHVTVSFGGGCASTETLFHTVHPDWYEMLSFPCTVVDNVSLVRDLLVQVFSRDILLGETSIPIGYVMDQHHDEPQWYFLHSKHFPDSQGRILCRFNLTASHKTQVKSDESTPPSSGLDIPYEPYDVKLFIMGCRLFHKTYGSLVDSDAAPEIQLEFGRQSGDPNMRLWYQVCDKPERGSAGQFDYFFSTQIQCFLPQSYLFQSFLELRVFESLDNECRELGTAYLHLTPKIPSFSPKMKQRIEAEFRYPCEPIEDFIPSQFVPDASMQNPFVPLGLHQSKIPSCLTQHSDLEIFKLAVSDHSIPFTPHDLSASSFHRSTTYHRLEDNSAVYASDMHVFYGRQSSLLNQYIDKPEYLDFIKETTWMNPTEEIHEQFEDLNRTLESVLQLDELPYVVLPILAPGRYTSTPGTPDVVGVIKVYCKILREEDNTTKEDQIIQDFHNECLSIPPLKARVHVLSASGLFPQATSSHNDKEEWYLSLDNGKEPPQKPNQTHKIQDTSFTAKGYAPDFYRSFELHVEFPYNTFLSVAVASAETLWTSSFLVGHTMVDLENRYFYFLHRPTKNETSPTIIETRLLRHIKNNTPVAQIRLWVELYTEQEILKIPLTPMTLALPELVQVRVVVWQLKGIPMEQLGSVSLYVVGMIPGVTSDQMTVHETDTYWNSLDGTAVFNWRFVFDTMVPSQVSQLRFQVWSRNILSSHEALAETVLELAVDLMKCKTLKQPVKLERAWIRLCHPAHRTQTMGYLDTEILLVPEDYALDHPVGLGREEPNEDPHLPEVLEHRDYISTSLIGTTVFGTSDKILYGAKLCSWLITFGVIITLYAVFCKIFFS